MLALAESTAQSAAPPSLPSVTMPSPNSSGLAEYANVNLNTGAMGTSIPLFNLKADHVSVPVSLNYNGTGIKVGQLGSWVGVWLRAV